MADGLLTSGLNWIDQQKQALKARFGLLADNPEEFARQLAAEQRQRAGVGLLGEPKTAQAIASRLVPAGIPITDMDGAIYAESCDRWLGAINSHRLQHAGQDELTQQTLSADCRKRGLVHIYVQKVSNFSDN